MVQKKLHQPQIGKINQSKLFYAVVGIFGLLVVIGVSAFIISQQTKNAPIAGFSWCKAGNTVIIEDASLTAVGIEEYKSQRYDYTGTLCHLKYSNNSTPSDLFLDELALTQFNNKKAHSSGSWCLRYRIEKTKKEEELCFGENIKEKVEKISSIPRVESIKSLPRTNLEGSKWQYTIEVGGGVAGVMIFEKDDNGSLRGKFTQYGPEGKSEKTFIGSREENNFLLTLEEFPTFNIVLSEDGKTMTGKPVEEIKDIYYPNDFFKATIEQ